MDEKGLLVVNDMTVGFEGSWAVVTESRGLRFNRDAGKRVRRLADEDELMGEKEEDDTVDVIGKAAVEGDGREEVWPPEAAGVVDSWTDETPGQELIISGSAGIYLA